MVGKVNLSFDQRQSLYRLQEISRLSTRANERLTTQRRINSPVDGVTDYFISERLGETLNIIERRRTEIENGVSALQTQIDGIEGARDSLQTARGHLIDARRLALNGTASTSALEQGTQQFLDVFSSLILIVKDSEYLGLELLTSTDRRLEVRYSEDREQRLEVQGRNLFALDTDIATGGLFSGNGVRSGATGELFDLADNNILLSNFVPPRGTVSFIGFANFIDEPAFIDTIEENLTRALSRLETHERFFANNISILQSRLSFSYNFSNTLSNSLDDITKVDSSEEAVIISALQTRNSLAISSLSLLDGRNEQLLRLLQ